MGIHAPGHENFSGWVSLEDDGITTLGAHGGAAFFEVPMLRRAAALAKVRGVGSFVVSLGRDTSELGVLHDAFGGDVRLHHEVVEDQPPLTREQAIALIEQGSRDGSGADIIATRDLQTLDTTGWPLPAEQGSLPDFSLLR